MDAASLRALWTTILAGALPSASCDGNCQTTVREMTAIFPVGAHPSSADAGPGGAVTDIGRKCPSSLPREECLARCGPFHGYCAEVTVLGCCLAPSHGPDAVLCMLRGVETYCPGEPVCGRRPEGLAPAGASAGDDPGSHFARMAHLEAASVVAFRRLRDELRDHGAPVALVREATAAMADERRHARTMKALARRHGHDAPPVHAPAPSPRTLEAMALENAVEGCVRETFGALVARWQARAARDARVRRAMARIAEDETRHAALSWAVAEWADTRLPDDARARVARARQVAVAALRADARSAVPPSVAAEAGLPDARSAGWLVARAAEALWGDAFMEA